MFDRMLTAKLTVKKRRLNRLQRISFSFAFAPNRKKLTMDRIPQLRWGGAFFWAAVGVPVDSNSVLTGPV